MKTLIRTKLLDAKHLELRSDELHRDILKVIYCPRQDYKTHSHIGDLYQIYSLKDQQKGRVINTKISQFYPFKNYLMLKFLFKPKGKIQQTQLVDKQIVYDNKKAIAYIKNP